MAYRGGGFGMGFAWTPWVRRLIIANVVVFLAELAIPQAVVLLELTPRLVLTRPWTVVSYMFVHDPRSLWHILMNMLMLFFFGPPVEQRLGSDRFIRFYLLCGLGGAVLSFLFAYQDSVIGASGAVMGVMVAFAMFWPEAPVYIWGILPVKAKWLVGFLVVLDLYPAFTGRGGNIAHFAHLGGVVVAFAYLKWLDSRRRGAFGGTGGGGGGGGGFDSLRRKLSGKGASSKSGGPVRPAHRATDRAIHARRKEEERLLDEVDRILDKISSEGMSSLTPDEKRLLDDVSRKYRAN